MNNDVIGIDSVPCLDHLDKCGARQTKAMLFWSLSELSPLLLGGFCGSEAINISAV